jgi:hypothetical protein
MAGSQAITNNTASCFFDVAWSFSPLLVFVLMAGSRAITNNTASCSYYFITDLLVVGDCQRRICSSTNTNNGSKKYCSKNANSPCCTPPEFEGSFL